MGKPVSFASCSRINLVGFGVAINTFFNTSSCLALIVVRGPRLLFSLSRFSESLKSASSSLSSSLDIWDLGPGPPIQSNFSPCNDKSLSIPESPEPLLLFPRHVDEVDEKLESTGRVVFIWHMKLWSSQYNKPSAGLY